jgi:VanZ family protein
MRFRSWLPAIGMMLVIFSASSFPAGDLPRFGLLDFVVKKTGHAMGYAILALCYLRPLSAGQAKDRYWPAFLLAILYSITDEFHQLLVPGRHPSPVDVGIDSFGAALALAFTSFFREKIQRRRNGRL